MSWTTANMELDDNQTQIIGTDMNELTVRGGNFSYKSSKQSTSTILIAISILSLFFSSPHGRSLVLYSSLWTILTMHLLII